MTTKRAEFHPLANIFPLMEGAAFEELKADIRENGLHDEIVMHEGKILDGRNRYRALCALVDEGCELAPGLSLDPETSYVYVQFETDVAVFGDRDLDPLSYVISKNLKRRHLDESQRAIVAARLANMRQGERTDLLGQEQSVPKADEAPASADKVGDRAQAWAMREAVADADSAASVAPAEPPAPEPSANLQKVYRKTAAQLLNVSERSVASAKQVLDTGAPELQQAVDAGEVAVSTAAAVAQLPEAEQQEIVARGPKEILAKAKELRAQKSAERHQQRLAKIADIAKGNAELPTGRKWPVIYADPPWRFEAWSEVTGGDKAAENHYPTMALDDIKALPVGDLATPDAVLFLWATVPMLPQALEVMAAWGFAYKSHMVWDKQHDGTGYWFRVRHELLLVGTRGDMPAPMRGHCQYSSVLGIKRAARHSEKPIEFHNVIAAMFPALPRIELFARQPRPGWDAWGNQVSEVGDRRLAAPQVVAPAAPSPEARSAQEDPSPEARSAQGDDLLDIPPFLDRRRRAAAAAESA